jgi:hypothetical protein
MERAEVEAKLHEIQQALVEARNNFFQHRKAGEGTTKVLTQERAKEIIEGVKKPLASMQLAPGACICVRVCLFVCVF